MSPRGPRPGTGAGQGSYKLDPQKCPGAHSLPHVSAKGHCTPLKCAEKLITFNVATRRLVRGGQSPVSKKEFTDLARAEKPRNLSRAEEVAITHAKETVRAQALLQFRKDLVGLKDGLGGADAEEFADRKMVEALPLAIAEVWWRLNHGSDSQRWEAAKQVLESTGRGKKDLISGGGSPILIINGGNVAIPWAGGSVTPTVVEATGAVRVDPPKLSLEPPSLRSEVSSPRSAEPLPESVEGA